MAPEIISRLVSEALCERRPKDTSGRTVTLCGFPTSRASLDALKKDVPWLNIAGVVHLDCPVPLMEKVMQCWERGQQGDGFHG